MASDKEQGLISGIFETLMKPKASGQLEFLPNIVRKKLIQQGIISGQGDVWSPELQAELNEYAKAPMTKLEIASDAANVLDVPQVGKGLALAAPVIAPAITRFKKYAKGRGINSDDLLTELNIFARHSDKAQDRLDSLAHNKVLREVTKREAETRHIPKFGNRRDPDYASMNLDRMKRAIKFMKEKGYLPDNFIPYMDEFMLPKKTGEPTSLAGGLFSAFERAKSAGAIPKNTGGLKENTFAKLIHQRDKAGRFRREAEVDAEIAQGQIDTVLDFQKQYPNAKLTPDIDGKTTFGIYPLNREKIDSFLTRKKSMLKDAEEEVARQTKKRTNLVKYIEENEDGLRLKELTGEFPKAPLDVPVFEAPLLPAARYKDMPELNAEYEYLRDYARKNKTLSQVIKDPKFKKWLEKSAPRNMSEMDYLDEYARFKNMPEDTSKEDLEKLVKRGSKLTPTDINKSLIPYRKQDLKSSFLDLLNSSENLSKDEFYKKAAYGNPYYNPKTFGNDDFRQRRIDIDPSYDYYKYGGGKPKPQPTTMVDEARELQSNLPTANEIAENNLRRELRDKAKAAAQEKRQYALKARKEMRLGSKPLPDYKDPDYGKSWYEKLVDQQYRERAKRATEKLKEMNDQPQIDTSYQQNLFEDPTPEIPRPPSVQAEIDAVKRVRQLVNDPDYKLQQYVDKLKPEWEYMQSYMENPPTKVSPQELQEAERVVTGLRLKEIAQKAKALKKGKK